MSPQRKRLPDSWVQQIFSVMHGHYGTRWLNMWSTGQIMADGQDAGMVNAKEHWAIKLGGFHNDAGKRAIKQVFQILPAEPPSLPQFHDMVRQAYVPENVLMLEQRPTDEEMEANRVRLKAMMESLNFGKTA